MDNEGTRKRDHDRTMLRALQAGLAADFEAQRRHTDETRVAIAHRIEGAQVTIVDAIREVAARLDPN